MEWLGGHHIEVPFAQVSKACPGEQATSNSSSIGSVAAPRSSPLAGVLGREAEPGRRFPQTCSRYSRTAAMPSSSSR
jgi:hypothetical protein